MQRGTRKHLSIAVIVAVLLVTAGCSTTQPSESPVETQNSDDPQESETVPSQGESDVSSDAAVTGRTATVTRVIDGDTVEIRLQNGSEDTVRLLGVDTPETTYSRVSPSEYDGIPDTVAGRDHLFNWGEKAKTHAESTLNGEQVTVVMDAESDRRGYYGRLLAYIYIDGENFNAELLENGYARMYDSDFSNRTVFAQLEETAKTENTGLWGYTTTETTGSDVQRDVGVTIPTIHADAPGNDNENLNGEYIVLKNNEESQISIAGWTVHDEAGFTYTIPDGVTMSANDKITIYSGSGSDTETELYMESTRAVWNNNGDTVTITGENRETIIQKEY